MKSLTPPRHVDCLLRVFVRASLAASLVAALTACHSPAAEPDAPGQTTLIKTLNPQEFPELAPGKKIWTPSNNDEWAYDGALVGRWLFAASAPGRALIRCEIDPASGAPEFRQAWPIEATDTESGGVWLHVRRPSGKGPLLYVFFSTHHETSLLCYEVNAASGELALLGKSDQKMFPASDVGGGYGYPAFVWSPDGQRLYYVGVRKILTYTFADDGLPKAEGPALECRNPGSNKFRGRGHALFSPDGRQLYLLTEKPAEADGAWWQIDTYACDPASGALSYAATLDLPALAQECAELLAFSPDATRLLVIDEKPASLCTLGATRRRARCRFWPASSPTPA